MLSLTADQKSSKRKSRQNGRPPAIIRRKTRGVYYQTIVNPSRFLAEDASADVIPFCRRSQNRPLIDQWAQRTVPLSPHYSSSFSSWNGHIFQSIPELWIVNDKVNCRCFVFRYDHPFPFKNTNLYISKRIVAVLLDDIVFLLLTVAKGLIHMQ